jgi:hypothetical protein
MPVSFFYGQHDWMDPAAPIQLIEEGVFKDPSLHYIMGADHHVYMGNPTDFVFKFLLGTFSETIANQYIE